MVPVAPPRVEGEALQARSPPRVEGEALQARSPPRVEGEASPKVDPPRVEGEASPKVDPSVLGSWAELRQIHAQPNVRPSTRLAVMLAGSRVPVGPSVKSRRRHAWWHAGREETASHVGVLSCEHATPEQPTMAADRLGSSGAPRPRCQLRSSSGLFRGRCESLPVCPATSRPGMGPIEAPMLATRVKKRLVPSRPGPRHF
jgi:hypothetical protein